MRYECAQELRRFPVLAFCEQMFSKPLHVDYSLHAFVYVNPRDFTRRISASMLNIKQARLIHLINNNNNNNIVACFNLLWFIMYSSIIQLVLLRIALIILSVLGNKRFQQQCTAAIFLNTVTVLHCLYIKAICQCQLFCI